MRKVKKQRGYLSEEMFEGIEYNWAKAGLDTGTTENARKEKRSLRDGNKRIPTEGRKQGWLAFFLKGQRGRKSPSSVWYDEADRKSVV